MSARWEPAFVAVSVAIGEPVDAVLRAAGDAGMLHAGELVRALRAPSRESRARALARVLTEVALESEAWRLA
jgi:hypothetical protein